MKKNAYWVISRDVETTELKFSKRFHRRFEAREYFPYFRDSVQFWENVKVTLETMPVGELPPLHVAVGRNPRLIQ
jgi:hypothetical protein